jgi:exopolysaccharide biosynthesis polyprenyl glycosylphosphotransferase
VGDVLRSRTAATSWAKRLTDLAVATFLLVLLAVPMLIIAALIRLTSKGPALYTQDRIGLDGRVFQIYKFRSMRNDAEASSGPIWAADKDPRCTWIGRILRHTSVDELPQLINVVRGEMSLVGPRPERPYFVDKFSAELTDYAQRHRVRPGLTGWAQINGLRGNTCLNARLDHDLWYIRDWSWSWDLFILLFTPLHIWCGRKIR